MFRDCSDRTGEAIVRAAKDRRLALPPVAEFTSVAGQGIDAMAPDGRVLLGSRMLMDTRGIDVTPLAREAERLAADGKTVMYLDFTGRFLGLIAAADVLKPETAAAVTALRTLGTNIILLTGDNWHTAEAIARQARIDRVMAEVPPEDKAGEVHRLRAEGRAGLPTRRLSIGYAFHAFDASVCSPHRGPRCRPLGCSDRIRIERPLGFSLRQGSCVSRPCAMCIWVVCARGKPGWEHVRFVAHDLAQPLPFPDRSFDCVLASLVLDHIGDLTAFFSECGRVCRRGGRVLVSSFHPALMLAGIQARFIDPITGRDVRPASHQHQISDYVMGVVRSGLTLEYMSEHVIDGETAARSPRVAKYLGWPLLLLMRLRL